MKSENITLRTLEPTDVDFLYSLENNSNSWKVSNTLVPFSKDILTQYIQSAQDIFLVKQVRFVICDNERVRVGAIDLFDYDPINQRVGVGIIIDEQYRKKGYAFESLIATIKYCLDVLLIHSIYCNINSTNIESISLFNKAGFKLVGIKKDWVRTQYGWEDEGIYQLVLG
jgi:diamine N-acetyltransferase